MSPNARDWHRQLVTFCTGLSAVSLIVVGVLASYQASRVDFDDETIGRAQSVMGSLEAVEALVKYADANHRGYVITGDEVDLQPFQQIAGRLNDRLTEVRRSVRESPGQMRRLSMYQGLLRQQLDFMSIVIATRREQGLEAARDLLAANRDVLPAGEMQTFVREMSAEASAVAQSRRFARATEARYVRVLVILSLIGTLAGGLVVGLQARNEMRRRRAAELDARTTLEAVDQRVRERTRQLSDANAQLQEALSARAEALEREQRARGEAERANQLKDRFLATVSHELRTPLNAIIGWVHVVKSGTLKPEESGRAIEAIDRNAHAQTRLINDLLDVSRMMHGQLTLTVAPLDLRRVVDHALESIAPSAAAKQVTIDLDRDAAEVPVLGDEERLQQVAWNLIANAVKFTPHGGRIVVDVRSTATRALLGVADSGDGIEPEFLPQVFDPFQQGTTQSMRAGLGLGLAIVREIVERHGGTVAAASQGAGHGASFTVDLPRSLTAVAPPPPGAESRLAGRHVLVAEDDEDSAAALGAILRQHGCDVRVVRTAAECVQALGVWPADVLICDVGLPDEDGYALLRRIRPIADVGKIPAIALTAHAGDDARAHALAAGFQAHVTKPLDPLSLVSRIGQVLAAAESRRHD